MANRRLATFAITVSFVLGTLVGSGAYWRYQEIKLSKVEAATDLRSELSFLMDQVITVTTAFESLDLCSGRTSETNNKSIELHAKLLLHKQDLEEIERKLSVIEDREPRTINLQFSAPCPPGDVNIQ